MVPGCALLVVGFLAFAVFFQKAGARRTPPETGAVPAVASPAAPPSPSMLWPARPARAELLRLNPETVDGTQHVEVSDAPKPVVPQESREISCPNCGGSGRYVVEGTSQSCPMCAGTGHCRERIGARP